MLQRSCENSHCSFALKMVTHTWSNPYVTHAASQVHIAEQADHCGFVPEMITNLITPRSYPRCISGTTSAPFSVSQPVVAKPLSPSSDSAELSTSLQKGATLSDQSADFMSV